MTQEDKQLLLVDLSTRLPYGVIVNVKGFDYDYKDKLTQIYKGVGCSIQVTNNMPYDIEQIKPYLFPLSSMTEEQRSEYEELYLKHNYLYGADSKYMVQTWKIDWCNRNHFDYRGLIPMGLANDATGLNIY